MFPCRAFPLVSQNSLTQKTIAICQHYKKKIIQQKSIQQNVKLISYFVHFIIECQCFFFKGSIQHSQFPADLVTFTEEIRNGKS